MGHLDSGGPRYFSLVLMASTCVLISLWADFNLSAALIQAFYILMSLGGIAIRRRKWRSQTVRQYGPKDLNRSI